jgi:hypothetical protein
LTEILGYCLEHDLIFQRDFLNLIGLNEISENLTIKTQNSYSNIGRPDIEIYSNNCRIIIECKVEANERTNQLIDYAKLLTNSNKTYIKLVYLTKYIENKEIDFNKNSFIQICWYDIARIVNNDNQFYTSEFKQHLKELNMATVKYFNVVDLATLNAITETIDKMNTTLDAVKPYYIENFGGISKKSSRSTRLEDGWYVNYQGYSLNNRIKFKICYGYFWFWDSEGIPCIGFQVRIPTYGENYKTNEFFKAFSKELKSWIELWDVEEDGDDIVIANYHYISDFIVESEKDEQLKDIIDFLKSECIDKLIKIKQKNPTLFTGHKNESEEEL